PRCARDRGGRRQACSRRARRRAGTRPRLGSAEASVRALLPASLAIMGPVRPRPVLAWDSIGVNEAGAHHGDGGPTMLTFQAHGKEVLSLAFSPDGQRLATVSKEPNIRIWGETYDRPLLTCPCKTTVWAALTFSPDGRQLAYTGKFGADVWSL